MSSANYPNGNAPVVKVRKAEDLEGNLADSLEEARGWCKSTFAHVESASVVGDANVGGTSILSIAVAAGKVLIVKSIIIHTLAADIGIKIMKSTTAAIGGTNTDIISVDLEVDSNFTPFEFMKPPICIVDNSTGSSPVYFNIEMPQARVGGTANNANTQFVDCSVTYLLES
jgi:hypothetical protein